MLKPEKMIKVVIAGHKKDLSKVIDTLHQKKELKFLNVKETKKDITKLFAVVQKRVDELAKIKTMLDSKKKQITILEKLSFYKGNLEALREIKSLAFFIGEVKDSAALEQEINNITAGYHLETNKGKSKDFLILAAEKTAENKISSILPKFSFRPEPLDTIAEFKGMPEDILIRTRPEFEKLQKRHESIEASLNTLRSRLSSSLPLQENYLTKLTEKTEAPLRMAVTQNTFLVSGWLPQKNKDDTIKALNAATKGRIAIEHASFDEHERVPVKLNNPALIRPFEFFLDLYALPNHHEIDPTVFIFLGFPIFRSEERREGERGD